MTAPAVIAAGIWLSAAGCASFLLDVTPTEPIRETHKTVSVAGVTDLNVAIDKVLLGDDIVANGIDDESLLGVALRIDNRGAVPYELNVARVSLWMALDPNHPEATLSLSPIAGGPGPPPDELTVTATFPTIVVPAGQSQKAWIFFFGYQFPGSDIPRRVTLNLPGPGGQTIRVSLADPARGGLRWTIQGRRSQMMVGFDSGQLVGGPFEGIVPAMGVSRVARLGTWRWDIGLSSGVAVQQQGQLVSSTSAFSTLRLSAHLTAPLTTWGDWRNPRRLGLYAGGGAGLWVALTTPAEMTAGTVPATYGVYSAEGGLEFAIGAVPFAPTPFPLASEARLALPRWFLRIGYLQSWLAGGTSGGLATTFRVAF